MSSVVIPPYTSGFMLSCILVSMAFITALLLVSLDMNAIYGQVQNQKLGVNITSPERGPVSVLPILKI